MSADFDLRDQPKRGRHVTCTVCGEPVRELWLRARRPGGLCSRCLSSSLELRDEPSDRASQAAT